MQGYNLKAFLRFLFLNRKPIILINVVVTIISLIYLIFIIEPWFRSRATVITSGGDGSNLMSSIVGNLPFNFAGFSQSKVQRYIAVLNTQRVADSVINKYNLMTVYENDYRSDTYKAFWENLSIVDNEDDSFDIVFDYKNNPEKAAEIVNYIYNVLYEITKVINQKSASNYRQYILDYLQQKEHELIRFEDSLKQFQELNLVIEPQIQAGISLEMLGNLETELIKYQISLELLKESSPNDISRIRPLKSQINVIQSKINQLRSKSDNQLLAVRELPGLGLTYARLYRSVGVTTKVVEFLRLQYEQAVLDERKQTVDIQLLSKAQPSDRKVRPKRAGILLFIMILSGTMTIGYYRLRFAIQKHRSLIEDIIR